MHLAAAKGGGIAHSMQHHGSLFRDNMLSCIHRASRRPAVPPSLVPWSSVQRVSIRVAQTRPRRRRISRRTRADQCWLWLVEADARVSGAVLRRGIRHECRGRAPL